MRRFQLFEVLDQAWCPQSLRDGATDCLEAIISRFDIYRPVRADFLRAITLSPATRVTDLCSGGGGPWLSPGWRSALPASCTVLLTDKFPSSALAARLQADPVLSCVAESIDAACVPPKLRGFRTMFSSFHHFPDEVACTVLGDAVHCGDWFAMAEVTSRTGRAFAVVTAMPLLVWLITPSMRPLRWFRPVLTYLLPIIPLVVLFDGWVSCLRTRRPAELLALTARFPQYEWMAGYARARGAWLAPVYLMGHPKTQTQT